MALLFLNCEDQFINFLKVDFSKLKKFVKNQALIFCTIYLKITFTLLPICHLHLVSRLLKFNLFKTSLLSPPLTYSFHSFSVLVNGTLVSHLFRVKIQKLTLIPIFSLICNPVCEQVLSALPLKWRQPNTSYHLSSPPSS